MKPNVGTLDRLLRILLGIGLIYLAVTDPAISPWAWLGVPILFTGLLRFCALYSVFHFSTCPTEEIAP